MKHRLAFLQPEVPHYRQEFFDIIKEKCPGTDIYVFNTFSETKKQGFNIDTSGPKYIINKKIKGAILLYNPFPLLEKKYDTLVLMLNFAHITTWILLLTKWIHRKKIILWGQGVSVKRYLSEHEHPDWKLKWQVALADGIWTYQEPEAEQWKAIYPEKPIVALNNTLSGVEGMVAFSEELESKCLGYKKKLKEKYNITQDIIFIFCARFESNFRRTDLLIESIKRLNKAQYGFIIIGSGKNKPDFATYTNVYDFGSVYDTKVKQNLFTIADIYYQPGWVGLSIVEAMAYGKPIFTYQRSQDTYQCVEYCYVEDGVNGMIFTSIDDFIEKVEMLNKEKIKEMGHIAQKLVKSKLTPICMANNAVSIINI